MGSGYLGDLPGLWSRNTGLITLFETEAGPMAIVMAGALFVGNLEAVFPIPTKGPGLQVMDYDRPGATLGSINLGLRSEVGKSLVSADRQVDLPHLL